MSMPECKIVLAGCGGVGKGDFVRFLEALDGVTSGPFDSPCGWARVHPFCFCTNCGAVRFNVWCPKKRFAEFHGVQYVHAQGAIIMFDVNSRVTYKSVSGHHHRLTGHCGNIPIMLVGNNCHFNDRKVKKEQVAVFCGRKKMQHCEVSMRKMLNCDTILWPFLWLARKVTGHDDLQFVCPGGLKD